MVIDKGLKKIVIEALKEKALQSLPQKPKESK